MQISFEVLLDREWVPVRDQCGIILASGRFGYTTADGRTGVVAPPSYRLAEATCRDPEFRRYGWDCLSPEEREAAVARLGRTPQF
jgi:hypothetical protein